MDGVFVEPPREEADKDERWEPFPTSTCNVTSSHESPGEAHSVDVELRFLARSFQERELVIATVSGSTTPVEIRKIAQLASMYEWQ